MPGVLRVKNGATWETITPGHTVEDDGAAVGSEPVLNFTGDGVTVTDDPANEQTIVDIPGSVAGIAGHVITQHTDSATR